MRVSPQTRRLGFRLLAWVRLCAALVVLALFIRVFTSSLTQWRELRIGLMNLQFSSAVARGGNFAIAFLWLYCAVLFGRWYCGVVCPLGTAQEAVKKFAALNKNLTPKYIAPHRLRYIVPFLAGLGLILGLQPLFVLTDPISTFGRGVVGIFDLFTEGAANFNPPMWMSAAVFAAILVTAAARGRRFCDWCPVGTLFGICSRVAVFGVRINEKRCVSCGSCEKACPMNCADSKNKTLDNGRCVLCLNCAAACRFDAVYYGLAGSAADKTKTTAPRRAFFRGFVRFGSAAILYLFGRPFHRGLRRFFPAEKKTFEGNTLAPAPDAALGAALPPGAQDLEHLSLHCVGCKACVAACPVDLLRLSPVQPHLDYSRGYCQYNCTECGRVCPAGAIHALTLEEKHSTRIALSEFTRANCVVVTRGEACGACAEVCPTHALIMAPINDGLPDAAGGLTVPEFDPEYCIGCGGCLDVCPAQPKAFAVRGVSPQTRTPGMRSSVPEEEQGAGTPFNAGGDFPF